MFLTKSYYGLGTEINLSLQSVSEDQDTIFLDKTYRLIEKYEDLLTVNRTNSEIMSINRNAGKSFVSVSEITYSILKKSYEASLKNEGFNFTIGPLVKLWKIGFDGANLPRPEQIGAKLDLIDPKQVVFNDKKRAVKLQLTGMEIDLGAIAKGYIADAVKSFWQRSGILSGIINLGGNILLVGSSRHDRGYWQIGVQDPFKIRNLPLGILTDLRDCSVVTSGIYERYLKLNGMFYHHMFDSKTGYPIKK